MPDPHRLLPLKPVELLILTMLAGGDRHGYGIRQDILDHTEGRVEVEAGNLYRHLRGLEDDALVHPVRAPRGETDDRRIYYRLTPFGSRVLSAEMQRLRALVRLAEARGIIAAVPT
jgi:DNA-binding PadR family transcriptional regulator